jgi:hypothetical protein
MLIFRKVLVRIGGERNGGSAFFFLLNVFFVCLQTRLMKDSVSRARSSIVQNVFGISECVSAAGHSFDRRL